MLLALLLVFPLLFAYSGSMVRYRHGSDYSWHIIEDIKEERLPVSSVEDELFVSFSSDGINWSEESPVEYIVRENPLCPLSVKWSWNRVDGELYKYSIDGSDWVVTEDGFVIDEIEPNTLSTFSLQRSIDGIAWSSVSRQGVASIDREYRYAASLSVMASTMFRVAAFYDGEEANVGLGGLSRAVLSFPVSRHAAISLDVDFGLLGYSGVLYKELSAEGKARFTIPMEGIDLLLQIGGGESFVWKEGSFALYPMASIDFGFQRPLERNIALELLTGYYASFQRDGINHGLRLSLGASFLIGKGERIR